MSVQVAKDSGLQSMESQSGNIRLKSGEVVGVESVHAHFLSELRPIRKIAKDATKKEISSPTKTNMDA